MWSSVPNERAAFPDDVEAPYDVASASGGAFLQARPEQLAPAVVDPASAFDDAPIATYNLDIKTAGDYTIFVRFTSHDAGSDTFWLRVRETGDTYLFGVPTNDWRESKSFTNHWRSLATPVTASFDPNDPGATPEEAAVVSLTPGQYHLDIAMREDGAAIDQILLDRTGTVAGPGDTDKAAIPFAGQIPHLEPAIVPTTICADTNCDGVIDFFDIDPFVTALVAGQAEWEATHDCDFFVANDINADGIVDFFDIDPFVTAIVGGNGCP
jgi:hypothetical protein